MPYSIKMQGGSHCVVKADTGAVVKCHPTHEAALKHQRALMANVKASESSYGYWVDITGIQFEEDGTSQWIHAMPLGEWKHPSHGNIKFDLARLQRFAANVNQRTRGQDLDIDYDHKQLTTEAAGWVKQAKTEAQGPGAGLWLLVEWTSEGAKKIKEKAFRYFSPDFRDEWEHPKTGRKFKDVLFGGGITNRPFLKDMIPLNLHELCTASDDDADDNSSGGGMNRAFLETTARGYHIQFGEETSDEELQTKITEAAAVAASQDPTNGEDENESDSEEESDDDSGNGEQGGEGTDLETQLAEAAKTNPVVAALIAERKETNKRLAELEEDNKKQKVHAQLTELRTGKRQLSPASEKKLGEALLSNDPTKLTEFVKTVLKDDGIVQLGELGRQGPATQGGKGSDGSDDVATEFQAAINKALTEAKGKGVELSETEAMLEVSMTDPDLYERYRQGSYAQAD